ncbi:MAG: insulinase family protein, partial [Oscillospiraceae bacterium]|nr:insulinase family protein [Oscillospiraceae bacterium]
AGMTSKLFMNVREKLSLCYDIGSGYYTGKGILTVNAGIDWDKAELVQQEVLTQLDAVCRGDFTDEELEAARSALLSSLKKTCDTVGSIEGYYATAALSGHPYTPEVYMSVLEKITREEIMEVAKTVKLDTVYLLKGVEA